MEPDDKGNYPTTNPALPGPPPPWFHGAVDRWLHQCASCDLLVVVLAHRKHAYDDYEAETLHHCTRRRPGETAAVAQARLARGYIAQEDAKKWTEANERREEARRLDKARPIRSARQRDKEQAGVETVEEEEE